MPYGNENMMRVVPNSFRYYCYDANGRQLFIYLIADCDESWYVASLKQFTQEQIEAELRIINDRQKELSDILNNLENQLDAGEITEADSNEVWEKAKTKYPFVKWEDLVREKFEMHPLIIEQECLLRPD